MTWLSFPNPTKLSLVLAFPFLTLKEKKVNDSNILMVTCIVSSTKCFIYVISLKPHLLLCKINLTTPLLQTWKRLSLQKDVTCQRSYLREKVIVVLSGRPWKILLHWIEITDLQSWFPSSGLGLFNFSPDYSYWDFTNDIVYACSVWVTLSTVHVSFHFSFIGTPWHCFYYPIL